MDTSKYIKHCPRCGTPIEPQRCASWGDRLIGGFAGFGGAAIGFGIGGPVGAVVGTALGYEVGKHNMMSIEDDVDQNQLYIYKCPNCKLKWKEKIHTNDHPDDSSWLVNSTGYH